MAGLIDTNTGLAFGAGLEFQTAIGGSGLMVQTTPSWVLTAGGTAANLDVDFVNNRAWNLGATTSISTLLSCTRASSGSYTNADGTMQTFSSNTLRYGTSGLLVEEARTNILLYSQDQSNAAWSNAAGVVTANAAAAPDGTTTATRIAQSASNVQQVVTQSVSSTSTAHAVTVYVKKDTYDSVRLVVSNAAVTSYAAGVYTFSTDSFSFAAPVNWTVTTSFSTALANGWVRLTLIVSTPSATTVGLWVGPSNVATATLAGNISNTIFVWGAQIEAAAFPTSYIATTSSSAQRAADVVSLATSGFAYNASAQTIYAQYSSWVPVGAFLGVAWSLNNVAGTPQLGQNGSSQPLVWLASVGNLMTGSAMTRNVTLKTATAVQASNHGFSQNGSIVTSADANAIVSGTSFRFGSGGNGPLNGYLNRLAYWGSRVSNANLQVLTS